MCVLERLQVAIVSPSLFLHMLQLFNYRAISHREVRAHVYAWSYYDHQLNCLHYLLITLQLVNGHAGTLLRNALNLLLNQFPEGNGLSIYL